MKEIPLTQGRVALVDSKYYKALISMGSWQYHSGGYAYRQKRIAGRKRRQFYMHRVVLELADLNLSGLQVDHRNRRKLDNRRRNLRPCTNLQNQGNRSKRRSNKTGHKGVYYNKRLRKICRSDNDSWSGNLLRGVQNS